jgi:hypothetical protein
MKYGISGGMVLEAFAFIGLIYLSIKCKKSKKNDESIKWEYDKV